MSLFDLPVCDFRTGVRIQQFGAELGIVRRLNATKPAAPCPCVGTWDSSKLYNLVLPTVRTYSTFSPVAMIAFPFETSRTALPCLFTTKYTTRGGVPLEGIVIVAVPVQSAFTV